MTYICPQMWLTHMSESPMHIDLKDEERVVDPMTCRPTTDTLLKLAERNKTLEFDILRRQMDPFAEMADFNVPDPSVLDKYEPPW